MDYALLAALVALPALSSVLCLGIRQKGFRNALVLLTTVVMIAAAIFLITSVVGHDGRYTIPLGEQAVQGIGWVIKLADLAVLGYVIFRGISGKRYFSPMLAVIQLLALGAFEIFVRIREPELPVTIDYLSLTLILLASIIGPIILVYAIGYMDAHEEHLHLAKSRKPRFFAILFLFLAVMNALAMADNMLWVYTCWEITTLCSFLLISHDETDESIRNAFRTLDLNMLGGVAFIIAIIAIYMNSGTVSLTQITSMHLAAGSAGAGLFALGIACLCFAGFTKSAQFPFQSWLLGAMVAPTPVSALLHSSTMVKAGVYLVVRLATVISGSTLGSIVAFAGGFTFLAASAIAISQRNGKRVLAYSTIANLGLIICCAGIGSQAAIGAAILLIIFHAISKGLLFLCIGTIEQKIGSRDIEDMQGLLKIMPFTTFITVIGMISMLLPPFGVLMTKWLAIESAVHFPAVLILIILGSAFTVVFWAKWIGIILTMSYKTKYKIESMHASMRGALSILLLGVLAASCAVSPLYNLLINPQLKNMSFADNLSLSAYSGGIWLTNGQGFAGGVMAIPLFILLFALVFAIPYVFARTKPEAVKPPYFGGELANNDIRGIEFIGPGDKIEHIVVHNYYLSNLFGEQKLTLWMSLIAIAVIVIMFGVVI
ncbi:MAG TPA: proton-conducting transporter membrane subunit [Armatimonadota bacterium]|nr:proton-conducting transporter membrane subunit [Armatimonadota bacterium]